MRIRRNSNSRNLRQIQTFFLCLKIAIQPALSTILAASTVSSSQAWAIEVRIEKDLNLRGRATGRESLQREGVLKAGSVVEIPDRYRVDRDGKVDLQLTLDNWLRRASRDRQDRPGLYAFQARRSDYFFPVRVVSAAPGSTVPRSRSGENRYIALQHLTQQGQALVVNTDTILSAPLNAADARDFGAEPFGEPAASPVTSPVTSEYVPVQVEPPVSGQAHPVRPPTTLLPSEIEPMSVEIQDARASEPPPEIARHDEIFAEPTENQVPVVPVAASPQPTAAPARAELEARTVCTDGRCAEGDTRAPRRPLSSANEELIQSLIPALSHADYRQDRTRSRTLEDLTRLQTRFRQSCGFAVESFLSLVQERADRHGVPPDVLLSLMTQESSGRCDATNSEWNGTVSLGLFQVNTHATRIPRCSTDQLNELKRLSVNQLAQGPRCLENASVNLDEAIRILLQKRQAITASQTRALSGPVRGFDPEKMSTEDLWRAVVSAYNGGESWVLQAKLDLERFNQHNHRQTAATYDPHRWEDLRLFYLRQHLSPDQERRLFGRREVARSRNNALINLAYAENVIPRSIEFTCSKRTGISQYWRRLVSDARSQVVAQARGQ